MQAGAVLIERPYHSVAFVKVEKAGSVAVPVFAYQRTPGLGFDAASRAEMSRDATRSTKPSPLKSAPMPTRRR